MKYICFIFLTFIKLMSGTSIEKFKAPSFCGGLECPEFTTIKKLTQEIDVREYRDSIWVTVDMKGDREVSNKNSFWSLFNYISGKNMINEKIEMSVPVLVKVNSKIPFTSEEKWGSMSFFLGYKYQVDKTAPLPTGDGVVLTSIKSRRYGVISYSGYSNNEKQLENLSKLGTHLSNQGISFVNDYFLFAGYDAPYKFWSRHNEIWVELI